MIKGEAHHWLCRACGAVKEADAARRHAAAEHPDEQVPRFLDLDDSRSLPPDPGPVPY